MSVMIRDTPDVEEFPELRTHVGDTIVEKTRHSAFIRTDLEEILRRQEIDTLVLAGAFVDGCVGLTAIDAHERDFGVVLAKEATMSVNENRGESMLDLLDHEFEISRLANEAIVELIGKRSA